MSTHQFLRATEHQEFATRGRRIFHEIEEAIRLRPFAFVPMPVVDGLYAFKVEPIHYQDGVERQVILTNYAHKDGSMIPCYSTFIVTILTGGSMSKLETVWRVHIANRMTQIIADDIERRRRGRLVGNQYIDIAAGEDDFFLLLGTDNGKGIGRMLAARPLYFGGRNLKSVRIFLNRQEALHLCWVLEEPEEKPKQTEIPDRSSPMSRKEMRKHKRQQSSTASKC